MHREAKSYYDDGSDESDGEGDRRRVADETRSLIIKEFANRKRNLDKDKNRNGDAESAKYSKCKAAESTENKVSDCFIIIIYLTFVFFCWSPKLCCLQPKEI